MLDRLAATFTDTDTSDPDPEFSEDDLTPPTVDTSIGELCAVVKNDRRRWIIEYIAFCGACDLDELATARAMDRYGPSYTSQERKAIYVGFYQTHLPMMDDAGVVDYQNGNGGHAVEPGPHFDGYVEALDYLNAICTGGPGR